MIASNKQFDYSTGGGGYVDNVRIANSVYNY